MKARKMLMKRCTGYLAHMVGKLEETTSSFKSGLIVCEFLDMFSNELLRLALKREVEFSIELALRMIAISKALYRMTPTKLQELKKPLKELLDSGFICQSTYLD